MILRGAVFCRCFLGERGQCAERLGYLPARGSQGGDDLGHAEVIFDSLYVGNRQAGHGISLRVEDGEADVDDACDFIACATLVAADANFGEMLFEVGGLLLFRLARPLLDGTLAGVFGLVGQDDVAGGGDASGRPWSQP